MKLDEFMVDFQPQDKEVIVNASQLQDIMRMFKDYESVVKKQQVIISQKDACIDYLKAQVDDFKNGKMKVDLRG